MDQKTEKPTPKKIKDARKKGQVVHSKEVVSAAMLSSLVFYFWATGDLHVQLISDLIVLPSHFYKLPFNEALELVVESLMYKVAILTLPLIVLVILIALLSNYFQVGPLFVFDPIKPKAEKISVISGFKKIFSMKNLFEFIKSMIKIVFLSILVYLVIVRNISDLIKIPYCGETCLLPVVGRMVLLLLINSVVAFVVVAVVDYVFQKAQHIKELKMSKDEIKREYKEMEGNPEIKSQRKYIHKEILNSDMRAQVSGSSVIVANPTHVAIGLHYKKGENPLPVITLKGLDAVALKYRYIAEQEGVPVVENIWLARALLAQSEVGGYIPEGLIEPVAEIFSWLERVENQH